MQFDFRKQHLTKHTIVRLINKILKPSDNNCYTLGVFIDLTKSFDTVDHNILLRKLFHYGTRDNKLNFLHSHLQNRKQYIAYQNTLALLEAILFANDTNLFYLHNNAKEYLEL